MWERKDEREGHGADIVLLLQLLCPHLKSGRMDQGQCPHRPHNWDIRIGATTHTSQAVPLPVSQLLFPLAVTSHLVSLFLNI